MGKEEERKSSKAISSASSGALCTRGWGGWGSQRGAEVGDQAE